MFYLDYRYQKKQRTSSLDIEHALYLYFLGLSTRSVSKAIFCLRKVKRSHVAVWKWIQKYHPRKVFSKRKRISEYTVDDNIDFIILLKNFLSKKMGFECIAFEDPLRAIEFFRSVSPNAYSLVILDWRMPSMNGLILDTTIRQINNMVKIIMITAYDISVIKLQPEFEVARINLIIQKPIRMSFLKEKVNELVT
ncbi:response regulator [Candidatus Nitrosocosmicus agrestis]|jgi:CheY-like chemotaxis protein|uniref:response regulator n=1 Tax=Candidatus Nitrosocosmicus agrestis TaxID=2563600 RepID=UPI00122E72D7|nr:response regulator [Candidatus Nitrosocosmicus sp. SS]KAA2282184.1 response regulator [Candidatus Nitrosocosmicus sp. SS]